MQSVCAVLWLSFTCFSGSWVDQVLDVCSLCVLCCCYLLLVSLDLLLCLHSRTYICGLVALTPPAWVDDDGMMHTVMEGLLAKDVLYPSLLEISNKVMISSTMSWRLKDVLFFSYFQFLKVCVSVCLRVCFNTSILSLFSLYSLFILSLFFLYSLYICILYVLNLLPFLSHTHIFSVPLSTQHG